MPNLRSFRGVRYAAEQIGDKVCPPYDVISPDEQSRLYDRHEHNAIRLELARPDEEAGDVYAQVGRLFDQWLSTGVLVQEAGEALYVYRQDFTTPDGARHRVAGVLGALELEEFGTDSGVLPHERTMAGPKKDRLALMRACPVNISPIYAIYRGGGGLAPYLESLENRPPQARFQDDAGILHRLWVVTAPAEREMLSGAIAPGPLVIADGHHRYETALAFHREREAQGVPGDHSTLLCFCVDADAEDLVVLPYNRAVKTAVPRDAIVEMLRTRFAAEAVSPEDDLYEVLEKDPADHAFAFTFTDEVYIARVGDADVVAVTGERHPAWRSLDVVALHEIVLPELVEDDPQLRFSRDPQEIARLVNEEGYDFGVLLSALRAAEVVDVATSGERMPQKASYFWPKAVTGLVFHSLS